MSNAIRAFSWALSVVLAGALGFTWSSMSAQLDQKNNELIELQGKYNQLVSDANKKLQEANQRNMNLVAEANDKLEEASQRNASLTAEANEKIRLAQQPEVEVRVSFRKALLSSGNVAGLKNTSGITIAVIAEVSRPSSGSKRTYEFTLDPNQTAEIGEREGWAFVSGDKIEISQAQHKTLVFTSP